jgi:hypothetical protein
MPVPKRKKGETRKEYIRRLTSFFIHEGRKPDQAYAIANDIVRRMGKSKKKK